MQEDGLAVCKVAVVAFTFWCGCPGSDVRFLGWVTFDMQSMIYVWRLCSLLCVEWTIVCTEHRDWCLVTDNLRDILHGSLSNRSVKSKPLICRALLGNRACVSCDNVWQIVTYVVQQLFNHNLYSFACRDFRRLWERPNSLRAHQETMCVLYGLCIFIISTVGTMKSSECRCQ